MSLLRVENLSIQFRQGEQQIEAVRNLSFEIVKGEFFAMVGESGCGKSVTAHHIMRLLPDSAESSGEVWFDGVLLSTLNSESMRALRGSRIGMVFQEPMSALNPLHPIGRQISEIILLHQPNLSKTALQQELEILLDQVGLGAFKTRLHAYPHQLSGGERQRVMIAMAIANKPDLLIADEPTTALDVTLQAQILGLLKKLQRERGLSVLLITHDLSIVRQLADRVAVMRRGKLVEIAPTSQLFNAPAETYTQKLLASIPSGHPADVAADAPTIIACDNLRVTYAKSQGLFARKTARSIAIHGASLSIRQGETLGIVGESGSGKTTLGLALLRLIASEGPIVYQGHAIDALRGHALRALRQELQLVFQDPFASLNPRMNLHDIIAEGVRVHQSGLSCASIAERVQTILSDVGLAPEMVSRYPHELSGGQRQRVSIARAMILCPRLVVLDEPTSALDVSIQAQILKLLKRFQRQNGVSYLFISHDLRVVRAISHRVMVLHQGHIVEHNDTEALFADPQHDYTRSLIRSAFHPIEG